MESPTASAFVNAFNPMEKTHVLWLRKMNREMDKMDLSAKLNLDELVNSNPMGTKMTNGLDWVFIHFSLAMAYTKAVLEGRAWVPSK
jgi:hypothetical protein